MLGMMGQVMAMKNAQQQNMLGQQHLQAYRLENQERQHAMDAEKSLSELIGQNTHDEQVDRRAVLQGMAARGHAAHGAKWDAEQRANETAALDNAKKRIDLVKEHSQLLGQLLGPIVNAPPDTPLPALQAMYQDARGRAIQAIPGAEQEPPLLAVDPITGKPDLSRVRSHYEQAMSVDKQADQAHRMLEYQQQLATNAPTTAKGWSDLVTNMGGQADSQEHLDQIRTYLLHRSAPQEALNLLPTVWTPEIQKRLGLNALNPEQRMTAPKVQAETDEAQRRNAATRLGSAQTVGEYKTLGGAMDPKLFGQFPDYSEYEDSAPITSEDREQINTLGRTPEQNATAADRKITQGQTNVRIQQGEERIAILRDRAAKETATQRRNDDYALAQRALNDSNAKGGNWDGKGGYDQAIENVSKFYEGDEIGKNRGGVLKALNEMKAGHLRQDTSQANLDRKDQLTGIEKLQWMKDHPGEPVPTRSQFLSKGGGKKTTTTAKPVIPPPAAVTRPPADAPAATPPPAPAAAPAAATTPEKPATNQPKIPAAAQSVHDALKLHHVPFRMVDSADGLPLLEKDGKQYKVLGVDNDGGLKLLPGTWK